MRVRLIPWIALLAVSILFVSAGEAPAKPQTQAGFDFTNDPDPVTKFQNDLEAICNDILAFASKQTSLSRHAFANADELDVLESRLNTLMSSIKDEPSLSFLNTPDFRNLRSNTMSYLRLTQYLFRHAWHLKSLLAFHKTWHGTSSSLLGLNNMSDDFAKIKAILKSGEALLKNHTLLPNWRRQSDPVKKRLRENFLEDMIHYAPYAQYMGQGKQDGHLDPKVYNQATAIERYTQHAHEVWKTKIMGTLLLQFSEWVVQRERVENSRRNYQGKDEVLSATIIKVCDTMKGLEESILPLFNKEKGIVEKFVLDELPSETAVSGLAQKVQRLSLSVTTFYKEAVEIQDFLLGL